MRILIIPINQPHLLPDTYSMDMSAGSLFSSLIIGAIGLFLFMVGKRMGKPIYFGIGLAMCIYPYFVTDQMILWIITALLLIPVWTLRHA